MRLLLKFVICLTVFGVLTFVYIDQFVNTAKHGSKLSASRVFLKSRSDYQKSKRTTSKLKNHSNEVLNIWCIFTKVSSSSNLPSQFNMLINSILSHSHDVPIDLHVICDYYSKHVAKKIIGESMMLQRPKIDFKLNFYDIADAVHSVFDIVNVMTPYFSSKPGTYFSDSLFYLSLGLHRIAPLQQDKAILLDCDLQFRVSVKELYKQFDKFSSTNLFGISHELSSAYWYALYRYRKKNPESNFGLAPLNPTDKNYNESQSYFPGYNSGVMLLRLDRIRNSTFYSDLLTQDVVEHFVKKYHLRAQLGDQDYYTILGYEHPELFYTLDCGWNRQLCTWWRIHGNVQEFDRHFKCNSNVKIYHGNCKSVIPK